MDKSLDEIIGSAKPRSNDESKPERRRRGGRGRSGGRRGGDRNGQKGLRAVFIRNLSSAISDDDLRDLFRQVGPVVRVAVQRSSDGERSGLAWVLFDFPEDALVAAERFNHRKAAGQMITVQRVSRVGDLGNAGASLSERIGDGSRRRNRRNRTREGQRQPKTRNAEDLDAELDAYMQVEPEKPQDNPEPKEDTMIDV